ncbi:hypothetical protein A2U01_0083149, partial [Trifolium medium]|nr:hypothetical protein [Trifolium medium]
MSKGADESLKKDGPKVPTKPVSPEGGVASTLWTGSKTHGGGATALDKEGSGPPEGVRVGDIVVKLGACKERGFRNEVQKTGEGLKPS